MKVRLDLLRKAGETKRDGYVSACIGKGVVIDGYLTLPEEAWKDLNREYGGAGDIAASFFQVIAKSIDAAFGTDLKNCGGCKDRQKRWNIR